jgi:hypothetical protein
VRPLPRTRSRKPRRGALGALGAVAALAALAAIGVGIFSAGGIVSMVVVGIGSRATITSHGAFWKT